MWSNVYIITVSGISLGPEVGAFATNGAEVEGGGSAVGSGEAVTFYREPEGPDDFVVFFEACSIFFDPGGTWVRITGVAAPLRKLIPVVLPVAVLLARVVY